MDTPNVSEDVSVKMKFGIRYVQAIQQELWALSSGLLYGVSQQAPNQEQPAYSPGD